MTHDFSTYCPLCAGTTLRPVFSLKSVPVICNQLWPDIETAKAAAVGDVDLTLCDDCALVFNSAFDATRIVYAPGYENALHFSPKFQAFAQDLAAGFVKRHNLVGKHVFEIGCGDGHMLDLLSQNGVLTASGFDPSMAGKTTPYTARDGVEIIPEYFQPDQLDRPFDAILCRHVLEHLDAPVSLMRDIRRAISDRDVPIYFEVPNAGWMFDAVSMWDVIYEHVGYWSAASITTLFRRTGFEPVSVRSGYGEQFLMIEAKPASCEYDYISPDAEAVRKSAAVFADAANGELEKWRARFADLDANAVIWGAGSKGITFANALGDTCTSLVAFVDLNPRKHGLIVPGVALPVVSPEALSDLDPDLVLISNSLYEAEIRKQVTAMGLNPSFDVIAG